MALNLSPVDYRCPVHLLPPLLLLLLLLLPAAIPRATAQDNRCFLVGGGSAENFFVSESATVGSIIGVLRIAGDAGADGDIRLQLMDGPAHLQPIIAIAADTKNVVLIARLDKEGVTGPAQVTAQVTCDRRGSSTEPSLTIPLNVRVTDANDNAPVFVDGPYRALVSESALKGSVILQGIRARDADQPGPFSTVHLSVVAGPYSDYVEFASSLDGTLLLSRPLDFESVRSFNVTIRARDQGQPPLSATTDVLIDVLDADDQNPLFDAGDGYDARLPQPARKGAVLEVRPRPLRAVDQDLGLNASVRYAWNAAGGDYRAFHIDTVNATVSLARDLQDNEFVQPVTLVVKAFQVDNKDRYALTTLTVKRGSSFSPLLQFLQRLYNVAVLENVPVNTTLLMLAVNRPGDRNVRFVLGANSPAHFGVDRRGEVKLLRPLDFETKTSHQLVVVATDGVTNDTALVNVTVLNVNDGDPSFGADRYEFVVDAAEVRGYVDAAAAAPPAPLLIGHVTVRDADGDRVHLQLTGADARAFSISDDGRILLQNAGWINTTTAHFHVLGRDNGIPPRQTSVAVVVHLPAELVASAGGSAWWTSSETSPVLLIVLGILLGLLCLVISALTIYVCHWKQKKPVWPASPRVNPVYGASEPAHTATLRRNPMNPLNPMNPSGLRRVLPLGTPASPPVAPPIRHSHKNPTAVAAAASGSATPTSPVTDTTPTSPATPQQGNPRTEVIAWPSDSLPRRVKKLSWEDEYNVFF